jgi:transglutaminase-like putative cysteine protease
MESAIPIDNQPIAAGFFGEGRWLKDYVTPDEPDITMLWNSLTGNSIILHDKIMAAWDWVATQVAYKSFISAEIRVEGKESYQRDYWQSPAMCSKTHVGNCANKAFLLTSLLRNAMQPFEVYCVLGNLYNGHASGHAWVEVELGGQSWIVEATRADVSMVLASEAKRYEPVHYFNDQVVLAVPGRTVMTPFSACYSSWLHDYLDTAYINHGRM